MVVRVSSVAGLNDRIWDRGRSIAVTTWRAAARRCVELEYLRVQMEPILVIRFTGTDLDGSAAVRDLRSRANANLRTSVRYDL
jgi:hypothetical protein